MLPDQGSILAQPWIKNILTSFLKTPQQGAATSIHLASSPNVAGISGKYWVDSKPKTAKHVAYDEDLRRRFWDLSCEMAGVDADVAAALKSPGLAPVAPTSYL